MCDTSSLGIRMTKIRIEQYRNRAEELRQIAETMKDKDARATMLRVANDYENMADRLQDIKRSDVSGSEL